MANIHSMQITFAILTLAHQLGLAQMATIKNQTLVPRDRFGETEVIEGDILIQRRPPADCVCTCG